MGNDLYTGFTNILEIQSIFPIVTEDEMKGKVGGVSRSSLPHPHSGLINEFATKKEFHQKLKSPTYTEKVVDRVLGRGRNNPENGRLNIGGFFLKRFRYRIS